MGSLASTARLRGHSVSSSARRAITSTCSTASTVPAGEQTAGRNRRRTSVGGGDLLRSRPLSELTVEQLHSWLPAVGDVAQCGEVPRACGASPGVSDSQVRGRPPSLVTGQRGVGVVDGIAHPGELGRVDLGQAAASCRRTGEESASPHFRAWPHAVVGLPRPTMAAAARRAGVTASAVPAPTNVHVGPSAASSGHG